MRMDLAPVGALSANECLERAFHARSIAVVGASANRAKWANILFRRLLDGPYRGEVVAVNPARTEIEGRPSYPSVADIPFVPDYVQIVVPREQVAQALRDCARRGVALAHVFSSGFGEVGPPGPALESDLIQALAGGPTRMVGPNSLGIYSASAGIDFSRDCHFEPGPFTFISQSGSLCTDVLAIAQARGLCFSKILSVGNAADLDWPDFADYCAADEATGVAIFYVESVRDGRQFYAALQRLAARKPVLLLKGGRTGGGARSVASHTGRLAGDYAVWQAMMAQAGAIELRSLEDMLAAMQAYRSLQSCPSAAACGLMVVGSGGGVSVLISDAAHEQGLALAELALGTLATLTQIIPDAADLGGVGNPVEIPVDRMFGDLGRMGRIIEAAAADAAVGLLLLHVNLIALSNNYDDGGTAQWAFVCERLADISKRLGKPLAVVMRNGGCNELTRALERTGSEQLARKHGLPVFGHMAEALLYLRRCLDLREVLR